MLGAGFRNGATAGTRLRSRASYGGLTAGGVHVRASHIHGIKQHADKRPRPGNLRLPAAVSPVHLIKIEEGEAPQSAGAERRTRGRLAVGPVPSSEGTAGPSRGPARLAALHRGDFRGAWLHPPRAALADPGYWLFRPDSPAELPAHRS